MQARSEDQKQKKILGSKDTYAVRVEGGAWKDSYPY